MSPRIQSASAMSRQCLNAEGIAQWATGGVVRSDEGNFIVLYHDEEDNLLITQKLEATQGSPMWGEGKVVYHGCMSPYNHGNAPLVPDGDGGAVVAWTTCGGDIYAHRVVGTETATYSVGGMVSGLTGNGLELQINGADVTTVIVICENDSPEPFQINAGLNDAWYNPDTDGQGFFITVFPDLGLLSLAWFTYDTELPPEGAIANLGDPGHRWLTGVGPIEADQALLDIELTSGGIFDAATEIQRTDPPGSDGTLTVTFYGCNLGTVEYDIPSIDRQGLVPIVRVANDNIVICEALVDD